MYYAYMVRCADGSFYSGYASDPVARARTHNSGRGAKYTRARRPVELVYYEAFETRSEAMKRECALKRLTRHAKEGLVDAFTPNAQV